MLSKKIFLDSSALYAFLDRADTNHLKAVKIMEQLSLQGIFLYTSLLSIQEVYSAAQHQLGLTVAIELLEAALTSHMEILYPQKGDLSQALKLIRFQRNQQVTLKEALNAVVMQRKAINKIVTFTYWHNLLGSESYYAARVL